MYTRAETLWAAGAVVALALQALAQEEDSLLEREVPVEVWDRATRSLAERGLDLSLYYTLDALANVDGGVERRTELIGNLDLLAVADMEELVGWKGGTLSLYLLGNHGGISPSVGDIQGVSNIEGPPTLKVFEAWVQQELLEGNASVLAGLYDVNSEFDVIPGAALFLNGSQGMGAELGNSGLNGPSTFPVTSLGARIDARPGDAFYARFVVADGVPGALDDDKRTQLRLGDGDGVLLVGEAGVWNVPNVQPYGRMRRFGEALPVEERRYGFFGKFALGAWLYTGDFEPFPAPGITGSASISARPGVYALAEQRVLYEPEDPFQGLLVFARAGVADPRTNPIDGYLGGGLVYRGLLPGRDDDECGLAVAAARFGDEYRASLGGPGATWREWEVVLELTYRFDLARWLSLQPNFQRVFNPGGDPGLDDATVVGLRALVSF